MLLAPVDPLLPLLPPCFAKAAYPSWPVPATGPFRFSLSFSFSFSFSSTDSAVFVLPRKKKLGREDFPGLDLVGDFSLPPHSLKYPRR
jgi:hypothetical protein